MIKLLVSVTNKEEAMLAMEAGMDIIDLKNPSEGALGALPLAAISDIVNTVSGLRQTSATIGDLPMQPQLLVDAIENTARTGVDIIKIGFFDNGDHGACLSALKPLTAKGLKLIAVLFADQNPDISLLPKLQASGFYGVMLDTAVKNGYSLLDHMSLADLQLFIQSAHTCMLYCGLAGSIKIANVPLLAKLKPDYLGFRGALCIDSERKSALSKCRVKDLQGMLHKNNTPSTDWLKAQTT